MINDKFDSLKLGPKWEAFLARKAASHNVRGGRCRKGRWGKYENPDHVKQGVYEP